MNKKFNIKIAILALIVSAVPTLTAFASEPVYTVDQIMANPAELIDKTVTVKGVCEHVCTSSGKKIFLRNSAGKLFRFNAGDKVDRFNREALRKTVTITGVMTEKRTYLADLEKLEARLIEIEKKKTPTEEHCTTEAKANGENVNNTALERVRTQKEKLSKQIAEGGKDYLASYTINGCNDYTFE